MRGRARRPPAPFALPSIPALRAGRPARRSRGPDHRSGMRPETGAGPTKTQSRSAPTSRRRPLAGWLMSRPSAPAAHARQPLRRPPAPFALPSIPALRVGRPARRSRGPDHRSGMRPETGAGPTQTQSRSAPTSRRRPLAGWLMSRPPHPPRTRQPLRRPPAPFALPSIPALRAGPLAGWLMSRPSDPHRAAHHANRCVGRQRHSPCRRSPRCARGPSPGGSCRGPPHPPRTHANRCIGRQRHSPCRRSPRCARGPSPGGSCRYSHSSAPFFHS